MIHFQQSLFLKWFPSDLHTSVNTLTPIPVADSDLGLYGGGPKNFPACRALNIFAHKRGGGGASLRSSTAYIACVADQLNRRTLPAVEFVRRLLHT